MLYIVLETNVVDVADAAAVDFGGADANSVGSKWFMRVFLIFVFMSCYW